MLPKWQSDLLGLRFGSHVASRNLILSGVLMISLMVVAVSAPLSAVQPQSSIDLKHTNERGQSHCDGKMEYYDWDGDLEEAWVWKPAKKWYRPGKIPPFNTQSKLKYITWDGRRWSASITGDWQFRHCLNDKGPCHVDDKLQYLTRGSGKIELRLYPNGC